MRTPRTACHAYVAVLFVWACAATGCSGNTPSNSDVLKALRADDKLYALGCIDYRDFNRRNGYAAGEAYVVAYSVRRSPVVSVDECGNKLKSLAERDPVKAMGSAFSLLDAAYLNAGGQDVEGELRMVRTENGWMVEPR